tara:strand:- start:133 stop:306 length:174 start_codon:yes stop_codon:yes gene_type:complete
MDNLLLRTVKAEPMKCPVRVAEGLPEGTPIEGLDEAGLDSSFFCKIMINKQEKPVNV